MRNLNQITIAGNVTKDPETKQVNQTSLAKFSIANNRDYKKDGNNVGVVNFFNVEVWGKTAEFVEKYIKKGQPLLISGELVQNVYQDEAGNNKSNIFIKPNTFDGIYMLNKKENSGQESQPQSENRSPYDFSNQNPSYDTFDDSPF